MFNKLKNWRRVATRYDKTAESYLGFVALVSVTLSINLSVTARAGFVYTAAQSLSEAAAPIQTLVYGRTNADRLPEYFSADIGFVKPVIASKGFAGPIAYLSVNNFTDHDNPTSVVLAPAGTERHYRLFPGRRFNLGVVIPF